MYRCFLACLFLFPATEILARVLKVEVTHREDVQAFAHYEKIVGTIYFGFDPSNPENARIVDLDRAPVNDEGLVEAWGDFMVLQPKDPGSRCALLEVSNRGGKASLAYFNAGRFTSDPKAEEDFGDGLLMRQGFTVIWVGWQFDVPRDPSRLRLHVPVATDGNRPIEGLVRSDWVVDETVPNLKLGHRNHIAYPVSDPDRAGNVLTMRDGRLSPRTVVPRDEWRFVDNDRTSIHLPAGFQAGKIYEFVYCAEDPAVVGLGLAVIRDTISYAKYDEDCPFSVTRGIALGISQTGRFLRHFLYQGFNTDEEGRMAFDGMLIHTAGAGRGSFNHRFAQPSRDAHRYSAFFYPTDLFPFSGRVQRDPLTGRTEGLLDKEKHVPKIFYTNTGYEYWGRAASLLHTSLDGSADVEPLPEERIYHLASSQHFTRGFAPKQALKLEGADAYKDNPLDFLVTERALLVALKDWVMANRSPPASAYPRIDEGTLIPIASLRFPKIPGVSPPRVIHEAYRVDYGPRWNEGIITREPPDLGPAFPSQVSQVDPLGNEIAGVPTLEILVPLATYTPWHIRQGLPGGNGELTDFYGTYIPLPRTEEERTRTRDPRPSLASLHGSREKYLQKTEAASQTLVENRFLLKEDIPRVLRRAKLKWDWTDR